MLDLPPIGTEIPCSILALSAAVEYEGDVLRLSFMGAINYRVDVDPQRPIDGVRLNVIGFRVSADEPDEKWGTVTLEQDEVDENPPTFLKVAQQSPLKYEHRELLPFVAIFELSGRKSVTLTAKEPMVTQAELTRFPPKGDSYKLLKPVELIDPAYPDEVVARLTAFDSKRSGL